MDDTTKSESNVAPAAAAGGDFLLGLLSPLAPLYGLVTSARNQLYDSGLLVDYKTPLPVVCVGNATVGGTGKSPIAAAIAAEFVALGRKPVILSRGYGGSIAGPRIVTGDERADEVGDEPLMHRRFLNPSVPVVISRDRVLGAGFIAERKLGDVVILDDGYQHRRLRRNLNLLLIDISSENAIAEWTAGQLLPAGRFRESKEQALRRADLVVLVSRTGDEVEKRGAQIRATLPVLKSGVQPVVSIEIFPDRFIEVGTGQSISLDQMRGKRGIGACGLARPEHFFSALHQLGIETVRTEQFRDHHPFSPEDLKRLLKDGLPVFVTAKDAVKLMPHIKSGDPVFSLAQGYRFSGTPDQETTVSLLKSVLA